MKISAAAIATAIFATSTGCPRGVPSPVPPVNPPDESSGSDKAWAELQALHDATKTREDETPLTLMTPGLHILPAQLDLVAQSPPEEVAKTFLLRFADIWSISPEVVREATVRSSKHHSPAGAGVVSVEYRQQYKTIPVLGAVVSVHVSAEESAIIGVTGRFIPILEVATKPKLSAEAAFEKIREHKEQRGARLIIWTRAGEHKLAWAISVYSNDALEREVYVDALDGRILGEQPIARESLSRVLWNLRNQPGYTMDSCQRWQIRAPWSSWPSELTGCTQPACVACMSDPLACSNCLCAGSGDPAGCETSIWRYDESTGCVANGDPAGEGPCDSEALALWNDIGSAYNYWSTTFGRDSWNGTGGQIIAKVHAPPSFYAGITQPKYVNDDDAIEFVQLTVREGSTSPGLHGHELGHALQFGTETWDTESFHAQGIDAMEHNADTHGFRSRGLVFGPGYDCTPSTPPIHYSQFASANAGQGNKFIGNCQGWMLTRPGSTPFTYFGVSVPPIAPAVYDQIWFRALDVYFHTSHTYFDWWNDLVKAAHDLHGWGPAYFAVRDARDAIGGWSEVSRMRTPAPAMIAADRLAMSSWTGAPRGPCVFFRSPANPAQIFWSCYAPAGWMHPVAFNDPAIDPAASEVSATVKKELSGERRHYVFWRGTDNRIRYRTFDPATVTPGPPTSIPILTAGAPAAAALSERVLLVYQPLSSPNQYRSFELGSSAAPIALPAPIHSNIAPSIAVFGSRIYAFRPGPIRYSAYTFASAGGSWSTARDLTAVLATDTHVDPAATTTLQPMTLTSYARTAGLLRLRMMFVVSGIGASNELWMLTMKENAPGELTPVGRPVPFAPMSSGTAKSAGGLAVGVPGYPLWFLWGQGAGSPRIVQQTMYGD